MLAIIIIVFIHCRTVVGVVFGAARNIKAVALPTLCGTCLGLEAVARRKLYSQSRAYSCHAIEKVLAIVRRNGGNNVQRL